MALENVESDGWGSVKFVALIHSVRYSLAKCGVILAGQQNVVLFLIGSHASILPVKRKPQPLVGVF